MSGSTKEDKRVESVAIELWAHNWAIPTQSEDTTMEERLEAWNNEPNWVRSGFMAQARRAVAAADRSTSPDDLTDGYHTMGELYRQRMLWHAMFVEAATPHRHVQVRQKPTLVYILARDGATEDAPSDKDFTEKLELLKSRLEECHETLRTLRELHGDHGYIRAAGCSLESTIWNIETLLTDGD